jgi:hypothetical protein
MRGLGENGCSILTESVRRLYWRPAAVLELAYRADSNSAAREGLWVRVPPAVPDSFLGRPPCVALPPDDAACAKAPPFSSSYPYLLGIYLGDGVLSAGRRGVWRLRITMDSRYPGIIARVSSALLASGGHRVSGVQRSGCIEIGSYWKHWICLFPQHGHGVKHRRRIELTDWQRSLVTLYPDEFVAGLIHSDGCRCVNRVKGREYPRYFFTNMSEDIREFFTMACGMLGIECRPAGRRNISIARRSDVALMDRFVGPKH